MQNVNKESTLHTDRHGESVQSQNNKDTYLLRYYLYKKYSAREPWKN